MCRAEVTGSLVPTVAKQIQSVDPVGGHTARRSDTIEEDDPTRRRGVQSLSVLPKVSVGILKQADLFLSPALRTQSGITDNYVCTRLIHGANQPWTLRSAAEFHVFRRNQVRRTQLNDLIRWTFVEMFQSSSLLIGSLWALISPLQPTKRNPPESRKNVKFDIKSFNLKGNRAPSPFLHRMG